MIKKLLFAIMLALPMMGFAQAKFGVINSQTLMENMPEMKEVQSQLEASSKKYEEEFKGLQDEFQKKFTELQNMEESTPQTIKDRRMEDVRNLNEKIEQFRATATQDLQRQQEQLIAPIQQKVMTAIQAVGDEGEYTFIFENQIPVYVGKDAVDVTPLVKSKLGIK